MVLFRSPFLVFVLALYSFSVQPAAADDTWTYDFSESLRARYNQLHNQFRPGYNGDDQALNLMTLLQAEARRGKWALVGGLQDSRSCLYDSGSGIL